MNKNIKIVGLLLVTLLIVTPAMACTGPNCLSTISNTTTKLPSQSDITQAVSEGKMNAHASGAFPEAMMTLIKTKYTTWKADTWTSGSSEVISIYDDNGGLYFDGNGNQIDPSTSLVLKESYKGTSSGNTDLSTDSTNSGNNSSKDGSYQGIESIKAGSTSLQSEIQNYCPTCNNTSGNNSTLNSITSDVSTQKLSDGSQAETNHDAQLEEFRSYLESGDSFQIDDIVAKAKTIFCQ